MTNLQITSSESVSQSVLSWLIEVIVLHGGHLLEFIGMYDVLVVHNFGVDRSSVLLSRMLMLDKAKLDCLSKPFAFLLCSHKLVALGVFLDSERRVPDYENVTRDAGHHEIVQVVMQRCSTLLQSWISLHDYLISITLW